MSDAPDRIFVSIGVSQPDGGLDVLPGAINAARRMANWAQGQNYRIVLVHDKVQQKIDDGFDYDGVDEVTTELLRTEIVKAIDEITSERELKRLVVFFAGHGAALAIGDQYWILSNWDRSPTEAIKVSGLQRMLEYYGPSQVAMIGDACQEFSSRFIDINGSPVLDKSDEAPRRYELDQFFAVDVGKQAFMVKATDGEGAFCIFTEVLLDALEGDGEQTAFEQSGPDLVVTSQSLARYLDGNVAREAGKYGVRMEPRPKPGFYTDCVYAKKPPPSAGAGTVPANGAAAGGAPPDLGDSSAPQPPGAAPQPPAAPRIDERIVRKVQLVRPGRPELGELALTAQKAELLAAREARRVRYSDSVRSMDVRAHFETGCGLCVSGADVVGVEASFGEVSRVDENPNWFRLELEDNSSLGWSDVLVRTSDGRTYVTCAIKGFVTALSVLSETSVSVIQQPIGAHYAEAAMAIDLLARAHAGLISRDELIDNAIMIREGKHTIITMGCIAAQFYDLIRDVDSLRSMASFYASHQQPVPLDIILYGGGNISESDGRLYAEIPAVTARKPRTVEEGRQAFTYAATPRVQRHPIAGRIPWMRQAWGAVETAGCDESAEGWRRQAIEAMRQLAPGAFTNVHPAGRDALEDLARGNLSARFAQAFTTA